LNPQNVSAKQIITISECWQAFNDCCNISFRSLYHYSSRFKSTHSNRSL